MNKLRVILFYILNISIDECIDDMFWIVYLSYSIHKIA